jgi:prepilin-type N-terminal cleavage/methylation domain-containing protein
MSGIRNNAAARGFTITELLVVIFIIGLLLSIAVPGITKISAESRFSTAVQTINGAITRAYYASQADMQMTALRFVPGEWDYHEGEEGQRAFGRQHIVTYSYVGRANYEDNNGNFVSKFEERFERRPGSESIELPYDLWAAPIEAWADPRNDTIARDVLRGTPRAFELDASNPGSNNQRFLNSDDFLIVIDPQAGVKTGRELFPLRAYDPSPGVEREWEGERNFGSGRLTRPYQRYSSAGVVVYRREQFAAVAGADNTAAEQRQQVLRASGRPYFAHRFGGGLVMGTEEPR